MHLQAPPPPKKKKYFSKIYSLDQHTEPPEPTRRMKANGKEHTLSTLLERKRSVAEIPKYYAN